MTNIPNFEEYPLRCNGIRYDGGNKVTLINCWTQSGGLPEDNAIVDVRDVTTMRTGFRENAEYKRVSIYGLLKSRVGEIVKPQDVPSGRIGPEIKPLKSIYGKERMLTDFFFCRIASDVIDCDTHWDIRKPCR